MYCISLTGMLDMALSCLFIPVLRWIFEKLFTPDPPVQVQVVVQATVSPLSEMRLEHCEPEVAPDSPQRSRSIEYGPAATESHWPQWEVVSTELVAVALVEVVFVVDVVDVVLMVVVAPEEGRH